MPVAIALREVTKIFVEGANAIPALRSVNLDVHLGEVLMIVGPSGSGKTTLLSILGCILTPTSGSVAVFGKETASMSERELSDVRKNSLGFIFQGFNLFPALTAGENVELAFDVKGASPSLARKHAKRLMAHVALEDKYSSFPSDLSGGQKQRVAIARALAGEPRIILADEPTAALDSQTGRAIVQSIQHFAHEQQKAAVIVTHDPRLLELADRVVEVEDGTITS